MSFSVRYFLVDADGQVFRLPQARYERLASRAPRNTLPRFAGQRIRAAEVAVELRNHRPLQVVRLIFYYLHFDRDGCLDYDQYMKDGLTVAQSGVLRFT
jgi:hypothetical protein